jgi:membrane-associated phospholipid phosphatase
MSGNDAVQDVVEVFSTLCVPLFAVAVLLLWLGDRPGGPLRWRLATTSALAAAGLGLLLDQAIGHIWFRERPFTAHPADTVLLTSPTTDPSFPSDHSTAAFAIAFAVLFVSRRAGAVFLAGAVAVAVSRILVGAHYPGDVLAGALVGLASALAVTVLAKRPVAAVARLASVLTDPLVRPLWRALTRASAAWRGSRPAGPDADSP